MTTFDPSNYILTDDILLRYISEATTTPLLTAAEEKTLAQQIEQGFEAEQALVEGSATPSNIGFLHRQVEQGKAARDRMIVANTRLVINLAKKFAQQSGTPINDLIQEGNVGLIRAVDLFDYRRGTRFSTYATWWIRQYITNALDKYSRMIRIPTHIIDKYRKLRKSAEAFEKRHGREASLEELAAASKLSVADINDLQTIFQPVASLEEPQRPDTKYSLENKLAADPKYNPQNNLSSYALERMLRKALSTLPAREEKIITLRFGLYGEMPLSRQEIGQKFGLNRERIRQLELKALNRLRHVKLVRELSEFL